MKPFALLPACALWLLCAVAPMLAQIDYPDFTVSTGLRLAGSAAYSGGTIRLTPASRNQAGAVWHTTKQPVRDGFVTVFRFLLLNPGGSSDGVADGGDGFAFVVQNAADSAVGSLGGSIGYDGIANSIAIEFDTWDDGFRLNGDPNGNHISIHTRGILPNSSDHGYSLGATTAVAPLGDADTHSVVIAYRDEILRVYLDDCTRPILETAIDLDSALDLDRGRAWLGFTAATASAWEEHYILDWRASGIGVLEGDTIRFCAGDSARLTVASARGAYLWSTGEETGSITVDSPGVYTVMVTEDIGCGGLSYSRAIVVERDSMPEPVLTVGSMDLCEGDSVVLEVQEGFDFYRWSNGATTRSITVKSGGSYSVAVGKGVCGGATAPIVVTVSPRPSAVIDVSGGTVLCEGDSAMLDAGAGYTSYRWSNDATTQGIRVGTSGAYSVIVTNGGGCADTSGPVTITVHPLPQPKTIPNGVVDMCEGDSLTVKLTQRFASMRWLPTGATVDSIIVRDSGSYYVTVTDTNGCTAQSNPVLIRMRPRPVPPITAAGPVSICSGGTVTLDAPPDQFSYLWSTNATTRSITVTRGGFYTVTVIDPFGCRGTSRSFEVIVGDSLKPTITADGPTTICEGDTVTLQVPAGYASYRWSNGATTPSIRVAVAGTYSVAVEEASGCKGSSSPVTVNVLPRPPIPVIRELPGTLSTDPAPGYQWYFEGTPIAGATSQTHQPASEGTYAVMIIGSNGCTAISEPYRYYGASATIRPGDVTAAPGEQVIVPIRILAWTGIERPEFRRYRITVRFRASLLAPLEIPVSDIMQGDERVLQFDKTWNGSLAEGTLGDLRLIALLGDTTAGTIRVDAFEWIDGKANVAAEQGRFELRDLCELGGTRLLAVGNGAALKGVRPNPAAGKVMIEYDLLEAGHTELAITDMLGRRVATLVDGVMSPGGHVATLDASGLAPGLYICTLTTPTERSSGVLRVVR